MTDEDHNTHPAADQVGGVSLSIPLVLEGRLADLKRLMETNLTPSSTEEAQVGVYGVSVSIIASELVSVSFLGCFPKSAVRYVGGASRSQQPH